jgi:hypothetical protein
VSLLRPERVEVRRELNEIEYFTWCFGQPYNIVATVQIRGGVRADQLRAALDQAQRRHPLLAVNTEIAEDGVPWFSSEGVGPIPLTVLEDAEGAAQLVARELTATFTMDRRQAARPPLMRVSLLLPRDADQPATLLFAAHHVVADGLSLAFLVRDLLRVMEEPDAPVDVLAAPASAEDLLPARVRRRIPRSPRRFRIVLALVRTYAWLRFRRSAPTPRTHVQRQLAWRLTTQQTLRLRGCCHREGVSVQAAICTAYLPTFPAIQIPVNLRGLLARPVGESLGLFIGAANVSMKYRPTRGFWANARRFQTRMRRAVRDPFRLYRLVAKSVPASDFRRLLPLMVKIVALQRPFSISNLGELDRQGLHLVGRQLKVESFAGAVTGIVESSALTVYTIGGEMHLHLLATETDPLSTAVRDDAERALQRLLTAIGK